MNGKERMIVALTGGTPDQVPVGFFYNCDYKAECAGITPQEYVFGTNEDRFHAMAATYERHREDWIHADPGIGHEWLSKHRLIWDGCTAFVEEVATGQRDAICLDLTLASAEGKSHGPGLDYGYSYVRLNRPLESIRSNEDLGWAEVRTAEELIREGFFDPIRGLVQAYGDEVFITLPMGNLFFNSVYLFGLEEGLIATLTNPKLINALVELNTAQEIEVVKAAALVGLDGIWIAEMLVSADIVPPRVYKEMVAPMHRQIVSEAHRSGLKALAYLTGDCLPLLSTARSVGYDGVVVESQDKHADRIDVADLREGLGADVCVFGNLDPVDHLIGGDETTLRQEIRREINVAGQHGAFVMHSNIVSLPIRAERIEAVISFTREYGKYPLDLEEV